MKKYTLNFIDDSIKESKEKLGLNFNKKGFIFGFTVKDSFEGANKKLALVEEKWSDWVDVYNQWWSTPDKKKWKPVQIKGK